MGEDGEELDSSDESDGCNGNKGVDDDESDEDCGSNESPVQTAVKRRNLSPAPLPASLSAQVKALKAEVASLKRQLAQAVAEKESPASGPNWART